MYEFSTSQAIGIYVLGIAARSGTFHGVFAVDFELGSVSTLLNTSLARPGGDVAWAYIVERENGKLLGASAGDVLYDKSLPGSFTDQRLSATASRHPSIAASAQLLVAQGWPAMNYQNQDAPHRWEFKSQVYTGPKAQLDWVLIEGQDIHCVAGQIWLSLAGRCET